MSNQPAGSRSSFAATLILIGLVCAGVGFFLLQDAARLGVTALGVVSVIGGVVLLRQPWA
jgi:hypothetical protein